MKVWVSRRTVLVLACHRGVDGKVRFAGLNDVVGGPHTVVGAGSDPQLVERGVEAITGVSDVRVRALLTDIAHAAPAAGSVRTCCAVIHWSPFPAAAGCC